MKSSEVTSRYDREASAYRDLWAPVLLVATRRLVGELGGANVRRVLDVGAGVGSLLTELHVAFPDALVFAVDRSHGMLAIEPRDERRAVMDATRLAVRDGSMDRVLMSFMLQHLEEPVEGLRESLRAARPGGRLGFVTWARELESTATRVWTECLDSHGAVPTDPATLSRHDQTDTPEKMRALCQGAGFAPLRSWAEDLAYPIGLEHLLRLRTSMGSPKPRFEGLSPASQIACVQAARAHMTALAPADFIARGSVVYTVAVA